MCSFDARVVPVAPFSSCLPTRSAHHFLLFYYYDWALAYNDFFIEMNCSSGARVWKIIETMSILLSSKREKLKWNL